MQPLLSELQVTVIEKIQWHNYCSGKIILSGSPWLHNETRIFGSSLKPLNAAIVVIFSFELLFFFVMSLWALFMQTCL